MSAAPAVFAGQHVVITGGDGGLGTAVVDRFLAAGAECHLPIIGAPAGASRPGVHLTGPVDLTDERAVTEYYASIPSLAASIQLAGGFAAKPITETALADLDRQFKINVVTAFLCCREAVRAMRRNGSAGGRIVNVAARVVEQPGGGIAAYTAAKGAVAALTRALAAELREDRILVNAVLPSIIDTPANRAAMPAANFADWPKAAEIAETIVWLASPANTLTSGALVPVYGRG